MSEQVSLFLYDLKNFCLVLMNWLMIVVLELFSLSMDLNLHCFLQSIVWE